MDVVLPFLLPPVMFRNLQGALASLAITFPTQAGTHSTPVLKDRMNTVLDSIRALLISLLHTGSSLVVNPI